MSARPEADLGWWLATRRQMLESQGCRLIRSYRLRQPRPSDRTLRRDDRSAAAGPGVVRDVLDDPDGLLHPAHADAAASARADRPRFPYAPRCCRPGSSTRSHSPSASSWARCRPRRSVRSASWVRQEKPSAGISVSAGAAATAGAAADRRRPPTPRKCPSRRRSSRPARSSRPGAAPSHRRPQQLLVGTPPITA